MKKIVFLFLLITITGLIIFIYNFGYVNVTYKIPLAYQQQLSTLSGQDYINVNNLYYYPISTQESLKITCEEKKCYEFYTSNLREELDSEEQNLIRLSKGSDYQNVKFIGFTIPFKDALHYKFWISNIGKKSISFKEPIFKKE